MRYSSTLFTSPLGIVNVAGNGTKYSLIGFPSEIVENFCILDVVCNLDSDLDFLIEFIEEIVSLALVRQTDCYSCPVIDCIYPLIEK